MRVNNIEFFWKNIKLVNDVNYRHKADFSDFEKYTLIIRLDSDRSYFYNGKVVIIPGEFDILKYDKYFSELIGTEMSYKAIVEIFYVNGPQAKEENKINELDTIIHKLKKGEYGNIDTSKHWFLDIFPYIKCASFYCRDISMPEENKKFVPNYGGRCVELLSDKKIIIDDIPIEKSTIHHEMERLKEKNLRKIMAINGIPSNPFINYKNNKKEKDPAQKDITDSW
jgi:hypothetical protein